MGIYDRNKGIVGTKPNRWISYAITDDLRVKHSLKTRTVREPGGDSERACKALLAQRRREVRDGTWAPAAKGGSSGGATLQAYADAWLAEREKAGVKSVRNERQRLHDYVYPVLGSMRLVDIRRQHVAKLVADFQRTPLPTTEALPAPRMVHRVYEDLRTLFAHAVEVDELVPGTPCTLKVRRSELPKKKDADPRWRATAIYTREEVESLISDDRIEIPRRVNYGLLFLTGARIGEVIGMLWRDYDPTLQPLGRLIVATTYGGDDTKTESPRQVPVHPALATLLDAWKREGFAACMGRAPTPDDYIVPRWRSRGVGCKDLFQDPKTIWRHLQQDLAARGYRRRRVHDTRRTLVSLARSDGADKDILEWITHGPSLDDMQDLYSSFTWDVFCKQISALQISIRAETREARLRNVPWSDIT